MPPRFPVGVQSFKKIRTDNYRYVDKTGLMFRLVNELTYCFLSRPRRFGKSLLITTLKAYFEGEDALFEGLEAGRLHEGEWTRHPVLHLDLNAKNYNCLEALYEILNQHLEAWETIYGDDKYDRSVEERFTYVIRRAHELTGQRVVVLVDEYDKPMVLNIANPELQDEFRRALKGFYSVLKSEDEHIRFAMLTGVTKFTKVSVFSDLNNLTDITTDSAYTAICGLTEEEIHECFGADVHNLAVANRLTDEECYAELRRRYDGYHFCPEGTAMYNPYSVLNTLRRKKFADYWFESGTPTLLVEVLKETDYDLRRLVDNEVSGELLGSVETMHRDPLPLIFQTGYLTIKGYDAEFDEYHLGFPNEEVERGFVNFLLPFYTPLPKGEFNITSFIKDVRRGRPDDFMLRLQTLTTDTDYRVIGDAEKYFHNFLFLFFRLLGFYAEVEHPTSRSRMDMVVKTADYIYIFEFKIDGTADEALRQIDEKGYAEAFAADGREVCKIGVNFSRKERRIDDYRIEK